MTRWEGHQARCASCDKLAYATLLDALRAIGRLRAGGWPPLYVYRTRRCRGAWHITRKPRSHPGKGYPMGLA